jgi:uncharacterized protein
MAEDLGVSIKDLMHSEELRKRINIQNYVSDEVGVPTLRDIMEELAKPGRDPRKSFDFVQFSDNINDISDLRQGMVLPGVVTNITNFGAFVDIGVHQDGLVHVSHLADRFVKDPMDVVRVNQKVQVTVMEVDAARKRIALSMKANPFDQSPKPNREKPEPRKKETAKPKADLDALRRKFGR